MRPAHHDQHPRGPQLAAKCTQPFTPADPQAGTLAAAKCCTSDLTLAEFRQLNGKMDASDPDATTVEAYMAGTPDWRTDLYAPGTLMSHAESIALLTELGVKFTPELKAADVAMPYQGDYTQADYAQQLIDEYKAAGVDPQHVFAQSFNLDDVRYWIEHEPAFGRQAVYLDDRNEKEPALDPNDPATFAPDMPTLAEPGREDHRPADLDARDAERERRDRPVGVCQGRQGRRPRHRHLDARALRAA